MGKIDTDYLWLHEETPPPRSPLRRLALVLVIPLIGGAAWLTASPQSPSIGDATNSRVQAEGETGHLEVDALVGAGPARASAPQGLSGTDRQHADDLRVSEHDADAADVPLALASATDPGPAGAELEGEVLEHTTALATADEQTTLDVPEQPSEQWHKVTIQRGDTLSIAFNRNDLSYRDSLAIAHLPKHGERFTRGLRAGDTLRVKADTDGSVLTLEYPIDVLHTLRVEREGDAFSAQMALNDVEYRNAYAVGAIDTSFYVDALEAGLSDRQIMKLVKIFGWDIDFALDTRAGDRFVVVYEELYKDGDKIGEGDILAASFINRDRDVRAIRYEAAGDDQGTVYYSPEGRAMKKAFIRTPVDYTRISSRFNLSRKHPILNRIRRHEGTDYAAPSGTPIKATGSGRVVFRGRRGGYGNVIVIRHDAHLSTRYGHMSSFAKEFGVGSKVRQGDVIGYVGMSGLATGPHLHYEFRVDGHPKDPERVDLPKALPLPEKYMADFRQHSAPLLTQLDSLTQTDVAQAGSVRADDAAN